MDVFVERFKRRKIMSGRSSSQLYYFRQKPKAYDTVDVDVLAANIQKNYAVTRGNVKRITETLVEEIQTNLANGDKAKLNLFGTLRTTFRRPGAEGSEDCTIRNIFKVSICFIPDKELKLMDGSTAATRGPTSVAFALDKLADGSSSGGSGSENPGDGEENDPLG